MKKFAFLILIWLLLPIFAHAEIYKFSEKCNNSSYQCIACEYEATNVNKSQHVVLYAISNGNGSIDLSYEAFSMINGKQGISIVKWDVSSEKSKFIDEENNIIKCPDVFMKHDGAGNTEKISVHFGSNAQTQSTLVATEDNGKPFALDNVNFTELRCSNIPIYILGAGVVGTEGNFSTKNYRATSDTGTIVKGNNPYLELPAGYSSVEGWKAIDDNLISQCDAGIIIACTEQMNQSYQTAYVERTCFLSTKNELSERIEVDQNKRPTENSSSSSEHPGVSNISYDPEDDLSKNQLKDAFELCTKPSYRKALKVVGVVINIVRVIIPLLILAFGVKDLYMAIVGDKDERLMKAVKNIVFRIIAGVIIFLLPSIIQFLINLVSTWNDEGYKSHFSCCTDCAFNFNCDANSSCTE